MEPLTSIILTVALFALPFLARIFYSGQNSFKQVLILSGFQSMFSVFCVFVSNAIFLPKVISALYIFLIGHLMASAYVYLFPGAQSGHDWVTPLLAMFYSFLFFLVANAFIMIFALITVRVGKSLNPKNGEKTEILST